MAISECGGVIDQNQKEEQVHGTTEFPIGCYLDDLQKEDVPWHWHEELEAAVVSEGSTMVAIGSERYTLHAGDGFFINANALHGGWMTGEEPCKYHSLVFHPRLVGGSVESVFWQKYVIPIIKNANYSGFVLRREIPWMQEALRQIDKAWYACAEEPSGYEFVVRTALSKLLFILRENSSGESTRISARALHEAERLKSMLEFIQESYHASITVSDIARSAAVSESSCLRCFQSSLGVTPVRYLREYRIRKAKEFLQDETVSVSEVAERCGFTDMSYFSKCFRDIVGCTPSESRRQS